MRVTMTVLLAAASIALAGPAFALDRHVKVVNHTSEVMTKFQASNIKHKNWEEDILGRDTLNPGSSVRVNISDGTGGCMFDLRATFEDGQTVVRNGVNVCKVGTWTIN